MYSAEVFPLPQREQGMAWSVAVCLGFSSVLSLTVSRFVRRFLLFRNSTGLRY